MGHSQSVFGACTVATFVLLGGCGSQPGPSAPPRVAFTAPAAEAGHLMRFEGRLAFLPCGEGPSAIWIAESLAAGADAAEAWGQLGGGNRPVPALVRIAGDTIREVRHAAPEGGGCDRLPGAGDVNARGNEPFWHLRVDGDSAVVSTPELPDGAWYGQGGWTRPDSATWDYQAVAGEDTVRLRLDAVRCLDGMSGAWFPFRARMAWRGQQYDGCALEGEGAREAANVDS